MEFLKKYHNLSKDVRAKRHAYYNAKSKVTVQYPLIKLNAGSLTPMPVNCFSEFERVVGNGFDEDTPYCMQCGLFDAHEFCKNRKCDAFANNMDYVIALESFVRAKKMRREFVKNSLRGLVK